MPQTVPRDAFFRHLPPILADIGPQVQKLTCVASARVPVVKCTLCGVDVDIVFVAINMSRPPTDDEVLDTMAVMPLVAPDCRLSFNGIRTVLEIRRAVAAAGVPHEVFATALRGVKLWAKARHLYGSNFGYPGGVGYAVMVARACQVLRPDPPPNPADDEAAPPPTPVPQHTAWDVFRVFFRFLAAWMRDPARTHRIYITPSLAPFPNAPRFHGLPTTFGSTGAEYEGPFVVLNPAYPYVNTCYAMGRSATAWLRRDVALALATLDAHATQRRPWRHLLDRPSDYPQHYDLGFVVDVSHAPSRPRDPNASVAAEREWQQAASGALDGEVDGFVESKLKLLLYDLETRGCDVRAVPQRASHATRADGGRPNTLFVVLARSPPGASKKLRFALLQRSAAVVEAALTIGFSWPALRPPTIQFAVLGGGSPLGHAAGLRLLIGDVLAGAGACDLAVAEPTLAPREAEAKKRARPHHTDRRAADES